MKKYQIVEVAEQFHFAGTKATKDISKITEKLGYEPVYIRMNSKKRNIIAKVSRQIGYFFDWKKCIKAIEPGSVVLLQHPFHYPQLTREKVLRKLKKQKNIKFVSLVHDVEELRKFRFNEYYKNEFEFMLQIADVFIVHNEIMADYFVEKGVQREKIVELEIFDYLLKQPNQELPQFEKSITIAGNLDTTKCGYISELCDLESIKVNLYGSLVDEKLKDYDNIEYHGSFEPDEIPSKLTIGFGLVWDGESVTGCKGDSGQYLKYNNPHKLSLYLSSGLPIVIWKDAATAKFVKENHVGVCVDSLEELSDIFDAMDREQYEEYAKEARRVGTILQNGEFAQKAIRKAEEIIKESDRG